MMYFLYNYNNKNNKDNNTTQLFKHTIHADQDKLVYFVTVYIFSLAQKCILTCTCTIIHT